MQRCFKSADILLPDFTKTSPEKWSVIACDQFTSEPEYWQKAEDFVGGEPSTLNMILPEVYLSQTEKRIPKINSTMKSYLSDLLVNHRDSAVFTERTQSDGSVRRGIVMAVDLECYDYRKGAKSLIRATEQTVLERIPPRVAIRRGAALEIPHVMLLIDDPDMTVIEPLAVKCDGSVAYDFDMMLGGGHITGKFIPKDEFERIGNSLDALISPESLEKKYGSPDIAPLLFAVGDGNHSLASAKAAYEEVKARKGEAALEHPARFALCEIVNIHDPALKFEPIYRVMFGVDPEDVITQLCAYSDSLEGNSETQKVEYFAADGFSGNVEFLHPELQLTVGTLQSFIDLYIASHPGAKVDYIHGEDSVYKLSQTENAIGFTFGGMEKNQLFKTVIADGALPRKTFSMGHAVDKRYYLECRRIGLDEN